MRAPTEKQRATNGARGRAMQTDAVSVAMCPLRMHRSWSQCLPPLAVALCGCRCYRRLPSQNCCYYTVLCFTAKLCLSFRAGCRTRQDAFAISLGKINEHKSKQRLPAAKCGRVWDCAQGSGIVRSAQNGS